MTLSRQYASTDTQHDPLGGILLGLHSQKSHFCQKKTKNAIKQKKQKTPRPNFVQSFIGSIRLGKKRNGKKSSYGAVNFFGKNQKTPFFGIF